MSNPRFIIVCAVWGREYTDFFLNFSLPTFLSPGNLEHLSGHADCVYNLHTTPQDAVVIQASAAYQKLERLAEVHVTPVVHTAVNYPYGQMTACHTKAIKNFANDGTVFIFSSPDALWADGGLRYALAEIKSGKKAVLVAATRTSMEGMLPELKAHPDLVIPPRELVGMAMRHPHPQRVAQHWKSGSICFCVSHLHWPVANHGLVTRAFHVHPLMVVCDSGAAVPQTSIDGDLLLRMGVISEQEEMVRDSDDLCVVEASREAQHSREVCPGDPVALAAKWAVAHANANHREYVKKVIRFHSKPLDETWKPVEDESQQVVQAILGKL